MGKEISFMLNLLLSVLVLILLATNCEQSKRLSSVKNVSHLNDSLLQQEASRYRDTLGRERVKYKVQQITIEEMKMSTSKELLSIKEELRKMKLNPNKIHSTTIVQTSTVDTVTITIRDTLPCNSKETSKEVPVAFSDKWIDLKGDISFSKTSIGWAIDSTAISYSIDNTVSVTYAYKNKFFKADELHLSVMHDNPSTSTERVQTYVIKNKKKWYQQWWFNSLISFSAGIATGAIINSR